MSRASATDRLTSTLVCCAVLTAACGCRQSTESPVAKPSEAGSVTFTRDIAPIVFARCATCHHPGEAAPFNLLTYDDLHRRGRQIVEVTQKRLMPPWLPSEGEGHFLGARRLGVHRTVPAKPKQLRDPTGVALVGLHGHR